MKTDKLTDKIFSWYKKLSLSYIFELFLNSCLRHIARKKNGQLTLTGAPENIVPNIQSKSLEMKLQVKQVAR